jgi:hypothetical protein
MKLTREDMAFIVSFFVGWAVFKAWLTWGPQ